MFCPNCGVQIDGSPAFCSRCGYNLSGNVQSEEKETVLKEGLCNRVKSKFFVENGHGYLTNKRFIYSRHSIGKTLVMGVFVNLTKGDYDFEIPVSEISEIADGQQGFSKTIIIRTKSGQEYNFYFSDRQRWIIEFGNVIKK